MPAPALIVVVADDVQLASALAGDLERRFTPDYEVVTGSSDAAAQRLARWAKDGRDVAVVIAAAQRPAGQTTGAALLAGVRSVHPLARRLLLVAVSPDQRGAGGLEQVTPSR